MNSITIRIPKFDSNDTELEMHAFNPEDVLKVSLYTASSYNHNWFTNWTNSSQYKYAVVVEFKSYHGFIVAPYKKYSEARKVYEAMIKLIYEKELKDKQAVNT